MRKSFTLLEVLISTLLLAFVFVAMSNILTSLKRTESILQSKKEDKNDYLIKTLYYDIINADEINVSKTANPKIDTITLRTFNSLYKIPKPYVKWVVYKGALIRAESVDNFKENVGTIDKFAKNVKIFKIYKKDGKFLIFVNNKFFEFKGR
ncbi:PulJ/GspJ family protein [Caminibacter pacificus]